MIRVWSKDGVSLRGRFVTVLSAISMTFYGGSYFIAPEIWDARFTFADWMCEAFRLMLAAAVTFSWSQYVFRKETGWLFGAPRPRLRYRFRGLHMLRRMLAYLVIAIVSLTLVFNRLVVPVQLQVDLSLKQVVLTEELSGQMYLPYLPICLINYCFFFPVVFGAPILAAYYACSETRLISRRAKRLAQAKYAPECLARFNARLRKYRTYIQADATRFTQYLVLWCLLIGLRLAAGPESMITPAHDAFWYSQALLSIPAAMFFGALTVYGWTMSRVIFGIQRWRQYEAAESVHQEFRPGAILKRAIEYNLIMIVIIAITPIVVEIVF